MLERATPDSLVLVDELGRATDPEEGGALGVAVLEAFRRHGAFTLASTHLMAMKVYGASTPGVRNGSMGFDEETLEPTYVLRLGAPGEIGGPRYRKPPWLRSGVDRRGAFSDDHHGARRFAIPGRASRSHRCAGTGAARYCGPRAGARRSASIRSNRPGSAATPPRFANWSNRRRRLRRSSSSARRKRSAT